MCVVSGGPCDSDQGRGSRLSSWVPTLTPPTFRIGKDRLLSSFLSLEVRLSGVPSRDPDCEPDGSDTHLGSNSHRFTPGNPVPSDPSGERMERRDVPVLGGDVSVFESLRSHHPVPRSRCLSSSVTPPTCDGRSHWRSVTDGRPETDGLPHAYREPQTTPEPGTTLRCPTLPVTPYNPTSTVHPPSSRTFGPPGRSGNGRRSTVLPWAVRWEPECPALPSFRKPLYVGRHPTTTVLPPSFSAVDGVSPSGAVSGPKSLPRPQRGVKCLLCGLRISPCTERVR